MKYYASEIANRAKSLADLSNTDFISNEDDIHLINDSWREFYQMLINKGDKQFVREVSLHSLQGTGSVAEYDMPEDMFQMLSIRNVNTGTVLTRRAESEKQTGYEIFNDKIRIYGSPGSLVMTYYTVPEFITIPDKTIATDYTLDQVSDVNNIVNSFKKSSGQVYNVVTGETVYSDSTSGVLTGGKLVAVLGDNGITYSDFDGNEVSVVYNVYPNSDSYLIDSNNNKWIGNQVSTKFTFLSSTKTLDTSRTNGSTFRGIIFKDGNILSLYDGTFFLNEVEIDGITGIDTGCQYCKNFGDHEFVILGGYVFEYYNGSIQGYEELEYNGKMMFISKYGPVIYDGEVKCKSCLPDTQFNFPNELYVQVLASSLAIKYAMKQNANVDGLNNLYENYKGIFINSLSQDAGYTRIQNVYGV